MIGSYSVNTAIKRLSHKMIWIVIITLYLALLQINFSKTLIMKARKISLYLCPRCSPEDVTWFTYKCYLLAWRKYTMHMVHMYSKSVSIYISFSSILSWIGRSVIGIAYNIIYQCLY